LDAIGRYPVAEIARITDMSYGGARFIENAFV
jgi:hypothetical protein